MFWSLVPGRGGNMIPIQLSDVSGIDLVAANVLSALGEDVGEIDFDGADDKFYCSVVLHTLEQGRLNEVCFTEEIKEHLYRVNMYVQIGAEVNVFSGANNALGVAFFAFDSRDQLMRALGDIDEHIKVMVRT